MQLSRDEAQSRRLADQLEAEIRARVLAPGSKLLSSRALSEKFGLDRNVVRAAMDALEERRLIVKMPRKGIYVNPELLSLGRPELYIFTFGGLTPSYVETALDLGGSREYLRDFNVTLRYASWGELNLQTFENEMVKARQCSPGVVVLASTYIDRARIEILRRNEIPFVILGELHQEVTDLEFNQIFEQFAAKGLEVGKFFARSGFGELAYFTFPDRMLAYEVAYRTLLRCHAAAAGKKFREAPLGFNPESEVNTQKWQERAVRELFDSGTRPDLLHFIDSVDIAGLQRVLADFGLRIPEDVNVIVYHPLGVNPVPGIYEIFIDYREFSRSAFDLIGRCVRTGRPIGRNDLTHLVRYEIRQYRGDAGRDF